MSQEFKINIDGREILCRQGETVLEAAQRLDISIPTLCHDPRLDPVGACRSCLVEIEGQRRLQPSCAFKATPNMVVQTRNEQIDRHRTALMSLYMSDHASDMNLEGRGLLKENALVAMAQDFGPVLDLEPINAGREDRPLDKNAYIDFDPELCILCARCVRYCDEVEAVSAIGLVGRGAATTIGTAGMRGLLDTTCELCGGCIDTCPTGALSERKSLDLLKMVDSLQPQPEVKKVRSTCNFCGVGCQLDLNVADGRIVGVTSPGPGETLNDGNLCVKGRFAYDFVHHEERLTTPMIRGEDGKMHPASWEEALKVAAEGLLGVKDRWGADALGFVSSSRCTMEENYLMQKLARAAFRTNNVHQCAAT
jgi:predicted molibdopterin-dependent oxidoreductase YjgC